MRRTVYTVPATEGGLFVIPQVRANDGGDGVRRHSGVCRE